MNSRTLLVLIVLVGALVRYVDLGSINRGMQPDEPLYAYEGWSIQQTGTDHRQTGRPPLYLKGYSTTWDNRTSVIYPYILAGLFTFMPLNFWTERIPAATAGVLIIVIIYLIARELWPERQSIALLAAGLVAVSPTSVFWSRVGHDPILMPFFLSGMVLSILRTRRHPAWWLAAAACLALGLYGYQPFKFIGPLMFVAGVLWRRPLTGADGKWLGGAAILGLTVAGPFLYTQITYWSVVQSQANIIILFNKIGGLEWAWKNILWSIRYFLFGNIHFFIFLFPLFVMSLFIRRLTPGRTRGLLLAWCLIAITPNIITLHFPLELTSMAPRSLGLVGCLELGAAAAAVWLVERWRRAGAAGRRLTAICCVGAITLASLTWLTNAARSIAPRYVLGGMADGVAILQQPSLAERQVTWHLALPWIPDQLLWYSGFSPRQFQQESVELGPWLDDQSFELPARFGRYRVCRVEKCYQPHDGRLYVVPVMMLRDLPIIAEFTIREGEHVRYMPLHWKIVDNQ